MVVGAKKHTLLKEQHGRGIRTSKVNVLIEISSAVLDKRKMKKTGNGARYLKSLI